MTMIHIHASRPQAQPILILAVVVAIVATAVVYALAGALAALLVALLLSATLLGQWALGQRALATRDETRRSTVRLVPHPQCILRLPDGARRRAIVVLDQPSGDQLVLTAEGYVLLDARGRALYRL